MPRFAATQDRVNRACIRHLADASALLGGNPVDVIFTQEFLEIGANASSVASSYPAAKLPSSLVPSGVVGLTLQITSGSGFGSWIVSAHQPDGSGMSTLLLELA